MGNDSREYLLELLGRVREISALDDASALDELTELVDDIRFGGHWTREHAREVLAELRSEADHMRRQVERGVDPEHWWSGREFLRRLADFDSRWTDDMRHQFAGDIAELRHTAEPIGRAAAIRGIAAVIQAALKESIPNTMVVERMLRDMASAEEVLTQFGALQENAVVIRRVRERAARYRWQRKIDEAEVSEAGQNAKKAARLRAEASVLLRQDWLYAFPDEAPPAA